MLCLWTAKGGSGCTVTSIAVSLLAARRDETLLVDLGGDVAAAVGAQLAELPSSDLHPVGSGPANGTATHSSAAGQAWFDGADGADGSGPGWGVHGWGIAGWLQAPDPPPDALARFERPLAPGLALLPWGSTPMGGLLAGSERLLGGPIGTAVLGDDSASGSASRSAGGGAGGRGCPDAELLARVDDRVEVLARLLAEDHRQVVVDLGRGPGGVARWQSPLIDAAHCSVLVSRSCYLGLSRASRHQRPDGVVLIDEVGRALRPADVADALGVPVLASLSWDPAVARAVDAGLLLRRLPRSLRPLQSIVDGPELTW